MIKHNNGYFEFLIPKDRVTSASARTFALWITLASRTNDIDSNHILKKPNKTNY